jgi:hypothetical protein
MWRPSFRSDTAHRKQSHGIGEEVRVARKLQLLLQQAHSAIFGRREIRLEFGLPRPRRLDALPFRL